MPNWCSTKYIMFTDNEDKSELARLHNNLATAIQMGTDVENNFGSAWLGHVSTKHGFNWEDIPCRGTIEYLDEYEPGDGFFSLDTETAWGPCDELWEAIVAQYANVSYVYLSEEPGMGYFVNSDKEGRFLSERYLFEIYGDAPIPEGWYPYQDKPKSFEIREYFESFEGLADYCSQITGKVFSTLEELQDYLSDIFSAEDNISVCIHEFTSA